LELLGEEGCCTTISLRGRPERLQREILMMGRNLDDIYFLVGIQREIT
jgi:hypothetical protein